MLIRLPTWETPRLRSKEPDVQQDYMMTASSELMANLSIWPLAGSFPMASPNRGTASNSAKPGLRENPSYF
jgi:hypothetical protein